MTLNQTTRPAKTESRAYLAVLGASLAFFCTVGFVNAFGVFQDHYKANQLQDKSESDIAWIGSVMIFILYALAPVAGILVDKVGPTKLLCFGSIGQLVAIFMTSLCHEYYQFFLAQSVLLGLSMPFVTWPPVGVVSRHLPHRRGLALGIVIAGSSLGGVIWPLTLQRLLDYHKLSFGWTMRIVGFIMLPLLAFACFTILEAPRTPASQTGQRPEDVIESSPPSVMGEVEAKPVAKPTSPILTILRNKTFMFLAAGLAISYLGMFSPFFYVSSYASGMGQSSNISFAMISTINAASLFGRVVPGHMADQYGHYNIIVMAIFFSGLIGFCWTAVTSLAGLVIWSIAYGFTSGAIMSLQGACVGKIATHESQGTAMGLLMGSMAVFALVGTPISGQLVGHYGFLAMSMYTGATLVVGSILTAIARLTLSKELIANY